MPRKVLVVPNPTAAPSDAVSNILTEACALAALDLRIAPDLTQAARLALELRPAIMLFDTPTWDAPLQECLWQLSQLRSARGIRKLILASTATLDDRVAALEAGADDFLLKPISARELHARFLALLRSQQATHPEEDPQQLGALQLHREGMEIAIGEQRTKLSPREFGLLAYLMDRPGHVLSREELLENLWYPAGEVEDRRVVDVYIWRLREKIEDDPAHPLRLLTRRGEGYCLIDPQVP